DPSMAETRFLPLPLRGLAALFSDLTLGLGICPPGSSLTRFQRPEAPDTGDFWSSAPVGSPAPQQSRRYTGTRANRIALAIPLYIGTLVPNGTPIPSTTGGKHMGANEFLKP